MAESTGNGGGFVTFWVRRRLIVKGRWLMVVSQPVVTVSRATFSPVFWISRKTLTTLTFACGIVLSGRVEFPHYIAEKLTPDAKRTVPGTC